MKYCLGTKFKIFKLDLHYFILKCNIKYKSNMQLTPCYVFILVNSKFRGPLDSVLWLKAYKSGGSGPKSLRKTFIIIYNFCMVE